MIFAEVKKSRSHNAALSSLGKWLQKRIYEAATEYLADTGCSLTTQMYFNVALVDGQGHIQVMENAMMQSGAARRPVQKQIAKAQAGH